MSFMRVLVAAGLNLGLASMVAGCTSPVQTDADSVVAAQAKLLDFSYDASLDQFTHMSCTNMPMSSSASFNKSAYFTYRMGAYSKGGVELNDAFYMALKKYKSDQQADILSASPANTNTVLQLSMRGRLDYQNLYVKSGSAIAGQDYFNMLTSLGGSDVAQLLVNNPAGARIRHIRNGSAGGYLMEGSLYFSDNPALTQATRDFLQGAGNQQGNAGVLTMTYTNGAATKARSQADVVQGSAVNSSRSVYGRGYSPSFSQPSIGGLYSLFPKNTVTSMTEASLDGSTISPAPVWTCPASMQLRIIRAADLAKAGASDCVRKSDPSPLPADLKLLRNTLRVEDWYIDTAHRCMIPKHADLDCYGAATTITYTMGDTCSTDLATGLSNCVQFASTCYRTN
jgi:hypothetical protein